MKEFTVNGTKFKFKTDLSMPEGTALGFPEDLQDEDERLKYVAKVTAALSHKPKLLYSEEFIPEGCIYISKIEKGKELSYAAYIKAIKVVTMPYLRFLGISLE
jgi:hypothetical protein